MIIITKTPTYFLSNNSVWLIFGHIFHFMIHSREIGLVKIFGVSTKIIQNAICTYSNRNFITINLMTTWPTRCSSCVSAHSDKKISNPFKNQRRHLLTSDIICKWHQCLHVDFQHIVVSALQLMIILFSFQSTTRSTHRHANDMQISNRNKIVNVLHGKRVREFELDFIRHEPNRRKQSV